MTFEEFKSWLDGYSESFTGSPTLEQWKRIKQVLDTIHTDNNTARFMPYGIPNVIPSLQPVDTFYSGSRIT